MWPIWIKLRITDCRVHVGLGADGKAGVTMTGHLVARELRTPKPEARRLPTKEWTVSLRPGPWTGSLGGIGVLSHCAEVDDIDHYSAESFHLDVTTSQEQFAALLELLRTSPDGLTFGAHVAGLEYGWEPDGSGVEWDVATSSDLAVMDASFSRRVLRDAIADDEDEAASMIDDPVPPTALPQAPAQLPQLDAIAGLLRGLLFVAGALLVAVLLK